MSEPTAVASLLGSTAGDLVHFYSYLTGVSIELPARFERQPGTPTSAVYADLDDDGDDRDDRDDRGDGGDGETAAGRPRVQVTLVGLLDDDQRGAPPEARRPLVTALADHVAAALAGTGAEVVSRTPGTVDDEPVETLAVRQEDGARAHETLACSPVRLLSIASTHLAPATHDAAVASIRFIDL